VSRLPSRRTVTVQVDWLVSLPGTIGRLVDRIVRCGGDNPLANALEVATAEAGGGSITDSDIEESTESIIPSGDAGHLRR